MHVCGSHEQAIARFGLRRCCRRAQRHHGSWVPRVHHRRARGRRSRGARAAGRPCRDLRRHGARPGTVKSLADARAAGAQGPRRLQHRRRRSTCAGDGEQVVFFATGFETTAVATPRSSSQSAAELLRALGAQVRAAGDGDRRADPGDAHRGIPRGRARRDHHRVGPVRGFVERHQVPVVVAGFEPLDILAGAGRSWSSWSATAQPQVVNMYPRCVTRRATACAQQQLWQVFEPIGGRWRGIAHVPTATCACARSSRTSTPAGGSRSTSRRLLVATRRRSSSRVCLRRHHGRHRSRRATAGCSAVSARPTRRSAPAW